MKELVYSIVKEISEEKRENRQHPEYATRREILLKVVEVADRELSRLVTERKMRKGDTMNDVYFELRESSTAKCNV